MNTAIQNILTYYIWYVKIQGLIYVKINIINPLYLTFSKANWYFEETTKSKYLPLVPINESKEKNKKYEQLWIKIKYLIRSIT